MSYIGTTEIGKMFLGEIRIGKVYLGNDLVFSDESPMVEHTITKHPTSYDNDHNWYSQSNINNALADSDSTSYGQINYTRGSRAETYVYFKFDTSSIPAGATIEEVTCEIKCMTTGNSTNMPTRQVQMFTGTTAKGSPSSMPTSVGIITFSGVTWTLSELRDARVKVYAIRGTTQTSNNYYCRIYGATLTIKYKV